MGPRALPRLTEKTVTQARDEYQSYLPKVFKMVCEGCDDQLIAQHLGHITTEGMGLSANPEADLDVARLLLRWRSCVDIDSITAGTLSSG